MKIFNKISQKHAGSLPERWLWLGVWALGIAGVFAIILVVARTPQLAALTVFQQLFSVALVIHVDLSVLMWFLAMLGMGVSALLAQYRPSARMWSKAGFGTVAAATALMALSPLNPVWEVIKSNYVPVLDNPLFLLSLGILISGLLVLLIPMIGVALRLLCDKTTTGVVQAWSASALTTLLALLAFIWSGYAMPYGLPRDAMFEKLFWAGGHIFQFSFSLLMMGAWMALLSSMQAVTLARPLVRTSVWLMLTGAVISFAGFLRHPFDSAEFTGFQTKVMIEWGALGATVLALGILWRLRNTPRLRTSRAYGACLIMSLLVFFSGSALGLMIQGQNVTIPAHYHGMIVGITLALMGLAYSMLPRFGYASVAAQRLAFWQPIIYGVGQLMHIGGLGYSGGYGVLRKTPGAIQQIAPNVKIALGIMGFGGLLAIIGGILFVVVMVRARLRASASRQSVMVVNW